MIQLVNRDVWNYVTAFEKEKWSVMYKKVLKEIEKGKKNGTMYVANDRGVSV